MMRMLHASTALAALLCLTACSGATPDTAEAAADRIETETDATQADAAGPAPQPVPAEPAMVAAANPLAVEAGLDALLVGHVGGVQLLVALHRHRRRPLRHTWQPRQVGRP